MEYRNSNLLSAILLGSLLSIGLLGAGFFIAKAVYKAKTTEHYVTVKGLSERDVQADVGIWELDYKEIGGNLIDVNKQLAHDQTAVINFLKQNGFTDNELEVQPIRLNDLLANPYSQPNNSAQATQQRYILTGGVRVRTNRVALIQKTNQIASNLLQAGIPILLTDIPSVSPNPSFYFTQLDLVRSAMLAEATKSARHVAQQFALDSNSQLGGIRHANQGQFQIMSRDTSTQSDSWSNSQNALSAVNKKIRLVTTIDYYLK
jgi:uncharacterized protein